MRRADIAEVPRLRRDAGQAGFVFPVTLDKTVARRRTPESTAHAVIRKRGADEVDRIGFFGQVDREAGFVFAAARQGDILLGESGALPAQGVRPDRLLFGVAAPARHRQDAPGRAHRAQAGGQHGGGLPFKQDIRAGFDRRGQGDGKAALQRVPPVDQRQRPDVWQRKIRRIFGLVYGTNRFVHCAATPSSIMRVMSAGSFSPAAFIMLG